MRVLRFLLVFLGVAILVVGSIFWINRDTFITVFQNRAAIMEGSEWVEKTYSLGGFIEFMAEQPQHAALASTTVSPDGSRSYPQESHADPADASEPDPDPPGIGSTGPSVEKPSGTVDATSAELPEKKPGDYREIRYRSDRMHPAGTLSNFFLILTYADQVTSGVLQPDARVDPEKVSAFYLPDTDRRHRNNFEALLQNSSPSLTVSQLVSYLIRHNDPAAADYLFFYLGEDEVVNRVSRLANGLIEPPVPQFGIRMLARRIPESASLTEHLAALHQKKRSEFLDDAVALARSQWEDPSEVEAFEISGFEDQRTLHGLYPRLQPDLFTELLAKMWEGSLIRPEVSELSRKLLTRSPEDRLLSSHVSAYAAHFDERMSYMSGWSIGELEENKISRIQVILLHDLPAGLWFHMNSNFMVQDYHHRMFYDEQVRRRSFSLLIDTDMHPHSVFRNHEQ